MPNNLDLVPSKYVYIYTLLMIRVQAILIKLIRHKYCMANLSTRVASVSSQCPCKQTLILCKLWDSSPFCFYCESILNLVPRLTASGDAASYTPPHEMSYMRIAQCSLACIAIAYIVAQVSQFVEWHQCASSWRFQLFGSWIQILVT